MSADAKEKENYTISGSIQSGKKYIQFTKEIKAVNRNKAVDEALETLKDKYNVQTYHITIDEVQEGRGI